MLWSILHAYAKPAYPHDAPSDQLPGVPVQVQVQQMDWPPPGVTTPKPLTMDTWSVVPTCHPCTTPSNPNQASIVTCTHSQTTNRYAMLARDNNIDDDSNATNVHLQYALPVLDATTGQQLEHHQLEKHLHHKKVWDTYYAHKCGCQCHGISVTDTNQTAKHIEGTDTFTPIHYHNILPN